MQSIPVEKVVQIHITTHTNSIGNALANQQLSRRRAEEIQKQLMQLGVSATQVHVEPFGETNPIAANNSEEGTIVEIQLQALRPGSTIALKNFYFKNATTELLEESKPTLQQILKLLQVNQKLCIKVAGHVHAPGGRLPEGDALHQLSINRTKFVYDFLIEKGISSERLSYKGYANWKMIFPNALTEPQKQANRRVELKVVSN